MACLSKVRKFILCNAVNSLLWSTTCGCTLYKISESSVELLSLVLNMFDFGEGPTTRSSIRGTKSEAYSTPMKYITRAALHRASEYEETKVDALRGFPKLAKPKEDTCSKLGQSGSSSVFSEQERNLSIESDDEGFGSPTILPSILARPHHQLNQVVMCIFIIQLSFRRRGASGTTGVTHPSLGLRIRR